MHVSYSLVHLLRQERFPAPWTKKHPECQRKDTLTASCQISNQESHVKHGAQPSRVVR